ncbi:odorant receptor 46a-like isoform X2 [Rhynchophorus ferrugineus]|uniref:odorant receptor 46a-like isoform X2 n=1 Tax=Rhynchophorus ferrugineus TaxID=354439 RepID=UPI003FCC59A8
MKPVKYRELFKTDIFALKLSGLWIDIDKKRPIWHYPYAFVILGLFIYPVNLLSLINWVSTSTDVKMFASMCYLVMECHMAQYKSIIIMSNREECNKIFAMMDNDYLQPRNSSELTIVNGVLDKFSVLKKWMSFISMGAVVMITIYPMYNGEHLTPIRSWYPFNINFFPVFEIFYAHQTFAIWAIGIINIFSEVVITGFLTFIGLQFDLLAFRSQHLEKFTTHQIRQIVWNHHQILELFGLVKGVFGKIYFWQIFTTTVTFCMNMYLLSVADVKSFEFLYLFLYQTAIFLLLLFPCWFASVMTEKIVKTSMSYFAVLTNLDASENQLSI